MDENTGHPRQSATKPITRRSSCVAPARHSRCRQTHIRETHTQNALSPSSVCSSGAGVAAVHTTRLPAREKFGRRGACVARSCAKRKTIARSPSRSVFALSPAWHTFGGLPVACDDWHYYSHWSSLAPLHFFPLDFHFLRQRLARAALRVGP